MSLNCVFMITTFGFLHYWGASWSWSYGSWIYNYLCNQYLSQLKLCVRVPLMAWNTRYSKMWWNLSVTYDRYSGFLHQLKWPPRYNWNIVENGLRHHNPNTNTLFIDKSVIEHKTWLLIQFLLQGHMLIQFIHCSTSLLCVRIFDWTGTYECRGCQFYWWRKPQYMETTTDIIYIYIYI